MERDSYFDNYKGLLILLVVIGHFTGNFIEENHFMNFLIKTIYSFHMPAFVFISAYFSKRNNIIKLVRTLLLPYILFQTAYFVFLNLIGRENQFKLWEPYFTLWFLLSLFCWRILIDKIIKIRGILPISYALGILAGFVTIIGAAGSLERTITFLPFFILGYTFDKEKFMEFAHRDSVKTGALLLFISVLLFLFFCCEYIDFDILIMKHSYQKSNMLQWGWLYRILIYIFSTFLLYLIAVMIPRNKYWFTYLGQRTMSIYLLHGFIYKLVEYQTDLYENINTDIEGILVLFSAILLTFILSARPFDTLIKKCTSIPIEKLFIFG